MERDSGGSAHCALCNPEFHDQTQAPPPNEMPMQCVFFYASWAKNSCGRSEGEPRRDLRCQSLSPPGPGVRQPSGALDGLRERQRAGALQDAAAFVKPVLDVPTNQPASPRCSHRQHLHGAILVVRLTRMWIEARVR